jgi:xanthine dehydrogenase/oxidase
VQDVNKHQKLCAKTLGIPQHKLVSKTKRLGGGFGGKETRSAFLHCAVAVAAYHLQRPVKQDMQTTGHRHAFLGRYKVAAAADGRLLALDLQLYSNAGASRFSVIHDGILCTLATHIPLSTLLEAQCRRVQKVDDEGVDIGSYGAGNSVDLSHAIMDRAILHSDCGFNIPAVRITGKLCRTNQASNTAFRGFGGPQGMLIANTWMDALARKLGIPPETLQQRNLYTEGAITHFGQKLVHSQLQKCFETVMESSEWTRRREEVHAYNSQYK